MKLIFPFISFIIFFSISVSAQNSNVFPCKIKMKDGVVLNGFVRLDNSKYSPSEFKVFKDSKIIGETILITPIDADIVEIADSLYFKSARIKTFQNPIEKSAISESQEEPEREGTFFLSRLIKGNKLSLYILEDTVKTHFIIEDSYGSLTSLRYIMYYDYANGVSSIKTNPLFKNQLLAYVDNENEKVRKKILNTRFIRKDIIEAIININNSSELSQNAISSVNERRVFYPFLEAGAGIMSINFKGINPNLSAMSFSSKLVPKFSLGVELRFDKKERLFADIYASVYPYSFSATNTRLNQSGVSVVDKYELSARPIAAGVMLNYAVVKISETKILIGAGYALIINNVTRNSLTTTDKNLNGTTVNLTQSNVTRTVAQYSFDMDILLNNRISVRFGYLPLQDFSGLNFNSFKDNLISSVVKYRLGRK